MAKALSYEVPPRAKPDAAREELDQLLETLHQTGVLRLANDVLRASPEVSEILLAGLNKEESRNAVQNLSLLAMGLGRIPPERFASMTRAVTESLATMEQAATTGRRNEAPGLFGVYRLLRDTDLWRGLSPLISAIKAYPGHFHSHPKEPAARREDERTRQG